MGLINLMRIKRVILIQSVSNKGMPYIMDLTSYRYGFGKHIIKGYTISNNIGNHQIIIHNGIERKQSNNHI